VAPHPCFGRLGEQGANFVEETDVRRRSRTGRAADGRLVHFVDGLERVVAGHAEGASGFGFSPRQSGFGGAGGFRFSSFQGGFERRQQALADQRALARTAHAGDDHQSIQRKADRDVLEVIRAGVLERQPTVRSSRRKKALISFKAAPSRKCRRAPPYVGCYEDGTPLSPRWIALGLLRPQT